MQQQLLAYASLQLATCNDKAITPRQSSAKWQLCLYTHQHVWRIVNLGCLLLPHSALKAKPLGDSTEQLTNGCICAHNQMHE